MEPRAANGGNAWVDAPLVFLCGLLHYKEWVVVPADSTLCAKLMHEMHDTKIGGHLGVLRTYKKMGQQFY